MDIQYKFNLPIHISVALRLWKENLELVEEALQKEVIGKMNLSLLPASPY